jgi:hypothetical protein
LISTTLVDDDDLPDEGSAVVLELPALDAPR